MTQMMGLADNNFKTTIKNIFNILKNLKYDPMRRRKGRHKKEAREILELKNIF